MENPFLPDSLENQLEQQQLIPAAAKLGCPGHHAAEEIQVLLPSVWEQTRE